MAYGVILDTVSIQQYVFSTNSLKENLGASYLIKEIYESPLKETLKELFSLNEEAILSILEAWQKEPEKIAINNGAEFEIGYIGGGNAFILFKEKEKAQEFVKEWSKRLLVECPGLIPASAIGEIDINNFSESQKKLFEQLSNNKSSFVPQTMLPRHGITADCRRTGYSREIWCEKLPEEDQDFISSVSNAKIGAAESANKTHDELLRQYRDRFTFTDDLEKLGQLKNKDSHIAIVYIDGNDMGNRFKGQNSLVDLRKLSISVRNATKNAFQKMLAELIEKIPEMKDFKLDKEDNKTILPLRPIIIGGDDITFVSEGRLGIWLAEVFLEAFEEQTVSDGKPLTACAGIAITKTKYPFYRGYHLSEELTKSAKNKRKDKKDTGSWLDFHISSGGFSGTLSEIRKRQYKTTDYELLMRPYKLSDFKEILKGVAKLKSKGKEDKAEYPRSKIMKLREVLFLGKTEMELFEIELKAKELKLPKYKDFEGDRIVKDQKTPYFDMLELMELYPEFALKEASQ